MTFETLLIPTDGSDRAETAGRRGLDLAGALDASVHVLSVADSSVATGTGYSGDSPRVRERLREQANARATSFSEEAASRGLEATAAVREGIPAREIVDYADEHGIDAIVMGTSGRGAVVRAIVGSVADKVVRTASVPVMTINSEVVDPKVTRPTATSAGIETILLPTDGSEPANVAASRGLDLAAQLDATVHLLSVADADVVDALISAFDGEKGRAELVEQASENLAATGEEAHDRGIEFVTATTEGNPAEEIVDYADEHGVDAIVMGTHGRGGFERFAVGSVADGVVRTASVPVLTVTSSLSAETDDD
ncbi:universal stress protein UspA [Halalkaliarchaeum desulfuricum]|uniref:Universal stress protein UspA n=1 Tax=Halalkaliarchaeum desulfuricum TaxID=2055893 RepID=A0A343TG43_9EURY|nr:universal stress protein [Halalkaliarchaeum desulfuricum]AUX08065.1 universal stress protein UspA [Halalkaliarchaeum desulfuricum]